MSSQTYIGKHFSCSLLWGLGVHCKPSSLSTAAQLTHSKSFDFQCEHRHSHTLSSLAQHLWSLFFPSCSSFCLLIALIYACFFSMLTQKHTRLSFYFVLLKMYIGVGGEKVLSIYWMHVKKVAVMVTPSFSSYTGCVLWIKNIHRTLTWEHQIWFVFEACL